VQRARRTKRDDGSAVARYSRSMNPELRALVVRYVLMSIVLSLGGIIAAVWATAERDARDAAAAQTAPPAERAAPSRGAALPP
jgi:hypothetical protein